MYLCDARSERREKHNLPGEASIWNTWDEGDALSTFHRSRTRVEASTWCNGHVRPGRRESIATSPDCGKASPKETKSVLRMDVLASSLSRMNDKFHECD